MISRLLEFVKKNGTYLYPAYMYIRSNVVHRECAVMWDSLTITSRQDLYDVLNILTGYFS